MSQVNDQLENVDEWDSHGNPYWNGVARSGGHAPGTGKLHRARIENRRVVEVECHAAADSWVPFTTDSVPQESRRTCSRCGRLAKVPGVERDTWSRVKLTDEYAPAEWSPKVATDGGTSSEISDHALSRIVPDDKDPRLFSDLDPEDVMSDRMFQLWQKDLVDAVWDEDEECTRWRLTELATQMYREQGRDAVEQYIRATEAPDARPNAIRVIDDGE